jgi:hypothetical protein
MPAESLVKIKSDAIDLLSRVVSVYTSDIATGEVGAHGSAKASLTEPSRPCTGLLYGRIQSGKTVAMIALVAAAIDNGFRVIVVLTSDNVKLVSQTTDRFAALEGPIALDALSPETWSSDAKHIGKHLAQSGIVFVCSKNKARLAGLIEFLNEIGAPDFPALILDDEADQATLNTNLARSSRAVKKGGDAIDPTAIYTKVVDELRSSLRHHVFLQVTATPYALLLQSVGTELRPSFTRLLEPGAGYTGGEAFFEAEHIDGPQPPLIFVHPDESASILAGATDTPDGLRSAIAFFLVAAGAQELANPLAARSGQNFLCHTSQLRKEHKNLEGLVRSYIDRIGEHLEAKAGEALDRLHVAYGELGRTLPDRPPIEAILAQIERRLVTRKIVVINAEYPGELGRGLNFIVGGNILGRGVTIENLLVTYYLREPKMGQMDTMLQHARMYGYRSKLMVYTRVFLPEQLAVRFYEIHGIEKRLRRQLIAADMGKQIVIEKANNLYPTRRTVLDPGYIDAFDAEEQVYPKYPDLEMTKSEYDKILKFVQNLVGGSLSTSPQLVSIKFDDLFQLIDLVSYDAQPDSSSWVPGVLKHVVEKQRERCSGLAYFYTRKMNREKRVFATGVLSGDKLSELRRKDGPVFCAFRDDGKLIPGPPANPFWYPTLVLDSGMPSLIVNVTPDEPRE